MDKEYDLNTLDGINKIPLYKNKQQNVLWSSYETVEYKLLRKALVHRRNDRMDLAIACLQKANKLMPYSYFFWDFSDYIRLVNYLKLDNQLQEAECELCNLVKKFSIPFPGGIASLQKESPDDITLSLINDLSLYCDAMVYINAKREAFNAMSCLFHMYANRKSGSLSKKAIDYIGSMIYSGEMTIDVLYSQYIFVTQNTIMRDCVMTSSESYYLLTQNIQENQSSLVASTQLKNDINCFKNMREILNASDFPKTFQTFQKHKINNSEKYKKWLMEYNIYNEANSYN